MFIIKVYRTIHKQKMSVVLRYTKLKFLYKTVICTTALVVLYIYVRTCYIQILCKNGELLLF